MNINEVLDNALCAFMIIDIGKLFKNKTLVTYNESISINIIVYIRGSGTKLSVYYD